MKNMKKIVALLVAVLMLVASVSAFAANEDGTQWVDETHYDADFNGTTKDATISVSGLDPNDAVKFYQILEFDPTADNTVADATELKAGGWKVIAPFNDATNGITLAEFKAMLTTGIDETLAAKLGKLAASGSVKYNATADANGVATVSDNSETTTVVEPEAGLYVALVTPANVGYLYNPVFVSADYYTTTGGDKSSTWAVTELDSYANKSMAKRYPITITKTADEKAEAANETDAAKAVGVGDVITYTINTTIPEFANNYESPVFVITDKLSDGLTYGGNSTLTITPTLASGDTLTSADYDITNPTGTTFKITFKPASLLKLSAATPITITYEATVTETAITNVNEEDNTVTLEYSHEPSVDEEGEGKKIRDKTHHYTFTIDGVVWGDESYHGTEVVKIGIDKNGNEIKEERQLNNGYKVGALQGAEFKLYITDPTLGTPTEYNKGAYAAATPTAAGNKILSDEDGRLYINGQEGISGLDAGTYWLVEEKAPDGYIKQQAPVKIEIIPTFYTEYKFTETEDGVTYEITCDDVLQQYIVKIDNIQTAEYVLNYPDAVNGVYSTDEPTSVTGVDPTEAGDLVIGYTGKITVTEPEEADHYGKIKNTQGVELPSTGGMGTTILYIGGSVLVILAAVLLITKRRMSAND